MYRQNTIPYQKTMTVAIRPLSQRDYKQPIFKKMRSLCHETGTKRLDDKRNSAIFRRTESITYFGTYCTYNYCNN